MANGSAVYDKLNRTVYKFSGQVPLNERIIFNSKETLQNKSQKHKNNKARNYLIESNRSTTSVNIQYLLV